MRGWAGCCPGPPGPPGVPGASPATHFPWPPPATAVRPGPWPPGGTSPPRKVPHGPPQAPSPSRAPPGRPAHPSGPSAALQPHLANEGHLANVEQGPWGHQPGVPLSPRGSSCVPQCYCPVPKHFGFTEPSRAGGGSAQRFWGQSPQQPSGSAGAALPGRLEGAQEVPDFTGSQIPAGAGDAVPGGQGRGEGGGGC